MLLSPSDLYDRWSEKQKKGGNFHIGTAVLHSPPSAGKRQEKVTASELCSYLPVSAESCAPALAADQTQAEQMGH